MYPNQTTVDTPNRKLSMIDSPDFYMKSPEEMQALFPDLPEALENTVKMPKDATSKLPWENGICRNFKFPIINC